VNAVQARDSQDEQDAVSLWLNWALETATDSAHEAITNLLDLRPEDRESRMGYWGAPSFSPNDVVQYLRSRQRGTS
jgi:hypothetical protein